MNVPMISIPSFVTFNAARQNIRVRQARKSTEIVVHLGSAKMGFLVPNVDIAQSLVALGERLYTHALAAGYQLVEVKKV